MKASNYTKALLMSGAILLSTGATATVASAAGVGMNTVSAATQEATTSTTQTAPTTIDLTVHKGMTLTGKTQSSVKSDGETHSFTGDTTDYKAEKYGTVGFTAYDITNTVSAADLTDDGIKKIVAAIKADPTGNAYTSKASNKTSEQQIKTGNTTTFKGLAASDDTAEHHVWAVVETKHSKGLITQIADPIVVALPLTNQAGDKFQTTSHFYPKNVVTPLTFNIKKYGDSESTPLEGAKFQLYSGKPGSGTKVGTEVTTGKDGAAKISGLVVGSYYLVEEGSTNVADIDSDKDGNNNTKKYLMGADARNDANNKLAFTIGTDGVDPTSLNLKYINYASPAIKKTVVGRDDFTEGTMVPFNMPIDVPKDIAGGIAEITNNSITTSSYGVFNVTDTPAVGLNWTKSEADLKVTTADGKTTLVEGTDYTVTDTAKGGFNVDFILKNGRVSTTVAKLAGQKLNVTYKMALTDKAVVDKENYNEFDLAFQNHPTTDDKQVTHHITGHVPVYTYGAKFLKVSSGVFGTGVAATPLAGAEFVIKNADGKYFNGFVDGTDDDKVPEAQWVDSVDKVDKGILTSASDGTLEIQRIQAGTYEMHEIKAPTGYELQNNDQKFTVGKGTYTSKVYVLKDDTKPGLADTGSTEGKIERAIIAAGIAAAASATVGGVMWYRKRHAVTASKD